MVDCYTDPLGWNNAIQADGGNERDSNAIGASSQISTYHDISNLTSLLSNILKSSQGMYLVATVERSHFHTVEVSLRFDCKWLCFLN